MKLLGILPGLLHFVLLQCSHCSLLHFNTFWVHFGKGTLAMHCTKVLLFEGQRLRASEFQDLWILKSNGRSSNGFQSDSNRKTNEKLKELTTFDSKNLHRFDKPTDLNSWSVSSTNESGFSWKHVKTHFVIFVLHPLVVHRYHPSLVGHQVTP